MCVCKFIIYKKIYFKSKISNKFIFDIYAVDCIIQQEFNFM